MSWSLLLIPYYSLLSFPFRPCLVTKLVTSFSGLHGNALDKKMMQDVTLRGRQYQGATESGATSGTLVTAGAFTQMIPFGLIEVWRLDYNQHRPYSSLGHLALTKFVAQR